MRPSTANRRRALAVTRIVAASAVAVLGVEIVISGFSSTLSVGAELGFTGPLVRDQSELDLLGFRFFDSVESLPQVAQLRSALACRGCTQKVRLQVAVLPVPLVGWTG